MACSRPFTVKSNFEKPIPIGLKKMYLATAEMPLVLFASFLQPFPLSLQDLTAADLHYELLLNLPLLADILYDQLWPLEARELKRLEPIRLEKLVKTTYLKLLYFSID